MFDTDVMRLALAMRRSSLHLDRMWHTSPPNARNRHGGTTSDARRSEIISVGFGYVGTRLGRMEGSG